MRCEISVKDLDAFSIFTLLSEDEKQSLANCMSRVTVPANRFIIRQGTYGTAMLFLQEGKVKVIRADTSGKEFTIVYSTIGDCLGDLSIINNIPRIADVIAETPCILLELTKESFEEHIKHHSGLLYNLLKSVAHKAAIVTERMSELAFYDVKNRLLKALVSMASSTDADNHDSIVENCPSHRELATLVGTSREVITRLLKNLQTEKKIQSMGNVLLVHN